jgi:Tripartite ATP-independent periplasmic transporter, DctM component
MLTLGLLFGAVTLLFMFSGAPISFALGSVAVLFMYLFMPASALNTVTQNVYEEMASITLLSIPLFILKGAAIGRSRAGQDLCLPVRCLPPWPVPVQQLAPLSAAQASLRCVSAGTHLVLPLALLQRVAR